MKLNRQLKFLPVEQITFLYILITFVISFFLKLEIQEVKHLLYARLIIVVAIIGFAYMNSIFKSKIFRLLRYALIGGLLTYWYPETFEFNRYFTNCDHLLAHWEQMLFGFQPAVAFCQTFSQNWISELMHFGYFSYYLIIIVTSLFFYFTNPKYFKQYFFTIIFSFVVSYLIFILFPTTGPQYYFSVIGDKNASSGIFPTIGTFFNTHLVELKPDPTKGFFTQIVEFTQQVGERPTGAFPSSHVGITTLIMIMLVRHRNYIMTAIIFPIYFILVLSTVYIQAHFVIDVIAGFMLAFVLYGCSTVAYSFFTGKYRIPSFLPIKELQPVESLVLNEKEKQPTKK